MKHTRLTLLFMILFAPAICHGQINDNVFTGSSLSLPDTSAFMSKILSRQRAPGMVKDIFRTSGTFGLTLHNNLLPRLFEPIRAPKNIPEPGTAVIPLWHNGAFYASGSISRMPGLMQIDSGTIGIKQRNGNFSMYVGAVANKYGNYGGLHTQYGITGMVHYDFSPKSSITASGTYYFGRPPLMPNGKPMPAAMIGFYKFSEFNIIYEYQFNETFGLELGARSVPSSVYNQKYELRPVANPTIKIRDYKLSIPVGEIVYKIVQEEVRKRH